MTELFHQWNIVLNTLNDYLSQLMEINTKKNILSNNKETTKQYGKITLDYNVEHSDENEINSHYLTIEFNGVELRKNNPLKPQQVSDLLVELYHIEQLDNIDEIAKELKSYIYTTKEQINNDPLSIVRRALSDNIYWLIEELFDEQLIDEDEFVFPSVRYTNKVAKNNKYLTSLLDHSFYSERIRNSNYVYIQPGENFDTNSDIIYLIEEVDNVLDIIPINNKESFEMVYHIDMWNAYERITEQDVKLFDTELKRLYHTIFIQKHDEESIKENINEDILIEIYQELLEDILDSEPEWVKKLNPQVIGSNPSISIREKQEYFEDIATYMGLNDQVIQYTDRTFARSDIFTVFTRYLEGILEEQIIESDNVDKRAVREVKNKSKVDNLSSIDSNCRIFIEPDNYTIYYYEERETDDNKLEYLFSLESEKELVVTISNTVTNNNETKKLAPDSYDFYSYSKTPKITNRLH